MKQLLGVVRAYFLSLDRKVFVTVSMIVGVLIWINYHFQLNAWLLSPEHPLLRVAGFFALYLFVFAASYGIVSIGRTPEIAFSNWFCLLLVLAPLIFALKTSLRMTDAVSTLHSGFQWHRYLNIVLQWPAKAAMVSLLVSVLWRTAGFAPPVAGLQRKPGDLRPYIGLLLAFVPVLLLAAMGPAFQALYPKVKMVGFLAANPAVRFCSRAFFELCYGIDFFTIELFFRGFVVLGFVRFAGRDAILPAAAFYCTIHFGKPVAECISSFFGGLMLGAVAAHTRSIWGGLLIHLGLAWTMEGIGAAIA